MTATRNRTTTSARRRRSPSLRQTRDGSLRSRRRGSGTGGRHRWWTPEVRRAVEREARQFGLSPEAFLRSAIAVSKQIRTLLPAEGVFGGEDWIKGIDSPWFSAFLGAVVPSLIKTLQSSGLDALLRAMGSERKNADPPEPDTSSPVKDGRTPARSDAAGAPEPKWNRGIPVPDAPQPNSNAGTPVPGGPNLPAAPEGGQTLPVDWDWDWF
ncbi:hypothetical protein [Alicyclobacillus sp.]|uniref:hypothetical protein n=1 Tax=Alicyclobacillus sp. TaxID=61169 RepID=UPI0025BE7938|nr:hypothetical protein [Alicyclobacillus sp.]MCL6515361.1 hypothetical protein [Alicyclobacillus sp.]